MQAVEKLAEIMGWIAALALSMVLVLNRKIMVQQRERAVLSELVLAANRSLELSEVLETALDGVLSITGMDAGAVHLYDEKASAMVLAAERNFPGTMLGLLQAMPLEPPLSLAARSAVEKNPHFLEDIRTEKTSPLLEPAIKEGFNSAAAIPLFARGNLVATLLVCSRRRVRFGAKRTKFLTDIGHALGLAVANASLYRDVSAERRRMALVNEITKIINSSLDLQPTYQRFAEKVREVIDFDRCLVVLPVDQGEKVRVFFLATPFKTKLPEGIVIPLSGTSLDWVMRHKKPHFAQDLAESKSFIEDEILAAEGIRSAVRVPIWAKGEIIGAFILNSRQPGRYSPSDLSILEPIAEHLALSLEKHFLFQAVTDLSLTDELTGFGNRRLLAREMTREIRRADRYGRTFGVIMVDIDHFKKINDCFGHLVGDRVLVRLTQVIRDSVRDIDTCVRFGGEEFLVILPETDLAGCVAVAEKIRSRIEKTDFGLENLQIVTVSVGIAVYPRHAGTAEELVACADAALYRAKVEGRNRSFVCNEGAVEATFSLFKDF